jgi:hypothetical protein
MPVTFSCPDCHAVLKTANPIPAGKRIKCPKCNTVFAVPAEDARPKPAAAVQGKPRPQAPPLRKPAPPDDDDANGASPPRPARKTVPVDDYDDDDGGEPIARKPLRKRAPVDDLDDREEEDDDEDRPKRKSSKKRGKKKSGNGMLIGIIAGSLVLLLAVGGVGALVWPGFLLSSKDKDTAKGKSGGKDQTGPAVAGINEGTGNENPLAYVPADSTVIAGADVGAIWNMPFAAQMEQEIKTDANIRGLAELKKITGLEVKELADHVVVAAELPVGGATGPVGGPRGGMGGMGPGAMGGQAGMGGMAGRGPMGQMGGRPGMAGMGGGAMGGQAGMGGMGGGMGGAPAAAGPQNWVIIVKSKVPFSQEKVRDYLKEKGIEPTNHSGKCYYEASKAGPQFQGLKYLFMPSNRIIILTGVSDTQLEKWMESDGTQPALPDDAMSMIRTAEKGTSWLVVPFSSAIKTAIQQQQAQAAAMIPPELKPVADAIPNAKAFGMWDTLDTQKVTLHVALACADADSARNMVTGLQTWWNANIKGLGGIGLMIRGLLLKTPHSVQKVAGEAMSSAKFEAQGAMAEMSAESNLKSLEDLARELPKLGAQMGGQQFQQQPPNFPVPNGPMRPVRPIGPGK